MKIETKSTKRQEGTTILDVLFSSFKSNDLSIIDIIPYKRISEDGFLVDKNNEYQSFLRVKTTDLVSMNNSDLKRMINQLTTLCRIYVEPIKLISMTYASETSEQQAYWKRMINKYRRILAMQDLPHKEQVRYEMMLRLALDNLRRVVWVEDSLSELTFFFVCYGKNKKDLEIHIRDLKRLGGKQLELQQVDRANLEKILFRLNNMNTEL